MAWDWGRLSDVVRRLGLPRSDYAVDRIGHGLSRDPSSTAADVALLVTQDGWRALKERGWRPNARGDELHHPNEPRLTARIAALHRLGHELIEVDGVSVATADPPGPPATRASEAGRKGRRTALDAVFSWPVLGLVFAAVVYGVALVYPPVDTAATWQHLTFRTVKVEAEVQGWHETGRCYDNGRRIDLVLTWTQDDEWTLGSYSACNASTDDPQNIWVTGEGEIASQRPPWVDHLWPLLVVGLIPFAVVVAPLFGRLRDRWRARRRTGG